MKLFVIVFGIVLLSAPSFAECEDCFHGAWNLESITDSDGVVTTPADLGFYPQIQFLPDNSFTRLENMEIVSQGEWGVGFAMVGCAYGTICLQMLSTTTGDYWSDPVLVDNNVLVLKIGCPESATIERYTYISPTANETVELGSVKAFYR